jgi:hypothetical protein
MIDMIKYVSISLISLLAFVFSACSASTDSRYPKGSQKEVSQNEEYTEDSFNIEPYKAKMDIPDHKEEPIDKPLDLWFEYSARTDVKSDQKAPADTVPGYRVQVISTDNLEEATNIRSEIYFKANEKNIYILFEPPFYIVRVGDYKNINDAKALSFKLNQLGFSGTKVVSDLIIVYK